MSGSVLLERDGGKAWVTLSHGGKFNAMSRAMWRELRKAFEAVQLDHNIRCVVVRGEGGHFCAGGDISEYADFRFEEASLRDFHEDDVWGGLHAMLACDVPILAQIEGNCLGAGLEMASCCDIRIAGYSARFGAPIAKLGFPMAPREAALVMRAVGELTAREMLLTAAVLDALEMKQRGFLNSVVADGAVDAAVHLCVDSICALAGTAARLNKQSFRALAPVLRAHGATDLIANAYRYADTAEHREGVTAFIEKRQPRFAG
ncbi:MAG: enoyl-CoA hydratase/isomerase family protein [Polaromonas sp.]